MFKVTNMQQQKIIREGANTFSHHCIYIYIKTFSLKKLIILFSINLKTFYSPKKIKKESWLPQNIKHHNIYQHIRMISEETHKTGEIMLKM